MTVLSSLFSRTAGMILDRYRGEAALFQPKAGGDPVPCFIQIRRPRVNLNNPPEGGPHSLPISVKISKVYAPQIVPNGDKLTFPERVGETAKVFTIHEILADINNEWTLTVR